MTDQNAMVPMPAPMDALTYHAQPSMSSTGLREFMRSPAHYRQWLATPHEPSDAQEVGTLIHAAILEPDKLDSMMVQLPDDAPTRQSKAGKEWWEAFTAAAFRENRIIVKAATVAQVRGIRDAALANPAVQTLLEDCASEVSLSWTDGGVACRCRPDSLAVNYSRAIDLKSTEDARVDPFMRSIARYDYHIQAAWYSRGILAHSGVMPEWYWLAIEKAPPFAIAPYRATHKMLTRAHNLIDAALAQYRKCVEENFWPAYDPAIRDIDLPAWSYREQSNAEEF